MSINIILFKLALPNFVHLLMFTRPPVFDCRMCNEPSQVDSPKFDSIVITSPSQSNSRFLISAEVAFVNQFFPLFENSIFYSVIFG